MSDRRESSQSPPAAGISLKHILRTFQLRAAGNLDQAAESLRVHDVVLKSAPDRVELLDAASCEVATIASPEVRELDCMRLLVPSPAQDLGNLAVEILQHLVADLRETTEKTSEILQSLTHEELAGATLQRMVDKLAKLVGNPVIVKSPNHQVLAWSGEVSSFDAVREATVQSGYVSDEMLAYLNSEGVLDRLKFSRGSIKVEANTEEGLEPRVVCPIHAGGTYIGYVSISEGSRPLDQVDLLSVESAASVLGLHLAHERALSHAVATRRSLLLSELLLTSSSSSISETAELLGIELDHQYAVLALRPEHPDHENAEDLLSGPGALIATLSFVLSNLRHPGIAIEEGDHLLALLPVVGKAGSREIAEAVIADLQSFHPGLAIKAGLGRAVDPAKDLGDSNREARLALRIQERSASHGLTAYEGMGALTLFGHLDDSTVKHFLSTVLGGDEQFLREFEHTFGAYVDNGFNKSAAARALYVHVNTVQYRLGKIARMSGFDLDTARGRFTLECALRLLQFTRS